MQGTCIEFRLVLTSIHETLQRVITLSDVVQPALEILGAAGQSFAIFQLFRLGGTPSRMVNVVFRAEE